MKEIFIIKDVKAKTFLITENSVNEWADNEGKASAFYSYEEARIHIVHKLQKGLYLIEKLFIKY